MQKIEFENGELVTGAYVEINGTNYPVHMPVYSGNTPLSAEIFNQMQDNMEEGIKTEYSTNELEIGTWVDGSKLYRKTINFGALPNSTTKSVAHGITNLKRIVSINGFSGSSINKGGIPIPHAVANNPVYIFTDDTNVTIGTTSDRTAYTITYVNVYYTKN